LLIRLKSPPLADVAGQILAAVGGEGTYFLAQKSSPAPPSLPPTLVAGEHA
jgi:hypothetical protein